MGKDLDDSEQTDNAYGCCGGEVDEEECPEDLDTI
jgi:hypothetical protein